MIFSEEYNVIIKTLIIYLIGCYMIFMIKHPKMFDERGNFKKFGLQKHETIYPFWLVTTVIGITTYYLLRINN